MTPVQIMSRYDRSHILYSADDGDLRQAVIAAVRARADLHGANLRCANLRSADLRGAQLRGADLRGADLVCANLEEVDLSGANLEGADLEGANLRGASLRGAKLAHVDLSGANLEGTDFEGADLEGADLEGADLKGVCGWRFPNAPDPVELRRRVASHIEAHPELHDQQEWGSGSPDPKCGTPCCVAGWACHLGGGDRGQGVANAAIRLLWVDGMPMPSFSAAASQEEILAALRWEKS